jgi:ATP-dependent Clp protease, protease subunit
MSINIPQEENPITVIINSSGGDVYTSFAIIDAIRGCKSPINTVGTGHIMSAASLILASGTGKRILTPNTSVMIHEMST